MERVLHCCLLLLASGDCNLIVPDQQPRLLLFVNPEFTFVSPPDLRRSVESTWLDEAFPSGIPRVNIWHLVAEKSPREILSRRKKSTRDLFAKLRVCPQRPRDGTQRGDVEVVAVRNHSALWMETDCRRFG
jgi:hypothetical protein